RRCGCGRRRAEIVRCDFGVEVGVGRVDRPAFEDLAGRLELKAADAVTLAGLRRDITSHRIGLQPVALLNVEERAGEAELVVEQRDLGADLEGLALLGSERAGRG